MGLCREAALSKVDVDYMLDVCRHYNLFTGSRAPEMKESRNDIHTVKRDMRNIRELKRKRERGQGRYGRDL